MGLCHSSCRPESARLRAIFIAPTKLKRFWFLPFNGRHSLSHALLGVTAPSEREPGGLLPFIGVLAKAQGYGRFSSPLRNSEIFTFHHSTDGTPSVTPFGRDSSLREGAGDGPESNGKELPWGAALFWGVIGRGRPGRCLGRRGRSGRPRHRLGAGRPGGGGGLPPPLAVWRRSGRHGWGRGKRGVQEVREV